MWRSAQWNQRHEGKKAHHGNPALVSCLLSPPLPKAVLWAEWGVCCTQLERTWKLPAGNAERAARDRNCQYPLAGLCCSGSTCRFPRARLSSCEFPRTQFNSSVTTVSTCIEMGESKHCNERLLRILQVVPGRGGSNMMGRMFLCALIKSRIRTWNMFLKI